MESWVPITLCDIRYCCQAPGPALTRQQVSRRSVLNILYQNPVNKVFFFDLHFIQGVLFTSVEYKVVIGEK